MSKKTYNIMSDVMIYNLIDEEQIILTINVLDNKLEVNTDAIKQYITNTNSRNIKIKSTDIINYVCDKVSYNSSTVSSNEINTKISSILQNLPQDIITYLYIDVCDFNTSIDMLPDSIEKIHINSTNFREKINKFPSKLKDLELKYYVHDINNFPKTLETLKLHNYNLKISKFPNKLKLLELYDYRYELNKLPKTLETLILHKYRYDKLDNLSTNLKVLHLCCKNNISLDNLPHNLKELYICCEYNKPLDNLPQELEILHLPYDYNFKLDNLPNTLKKLYLSSYDLNLDNLPDSLEELYFKFQTSDEININKIPKNLKVFYINASYTFNEEITKQISENNIKFKTNWMMPKYLNYHNLVTNDSEDNNEEIFNEIF